ncbi:unnamed protein product [Clonostachys chloroleuca]|uniref:Uncharacterized protein n=1 Tax=Clonostachys chloroleuca TaxID=1926264 RepID=A0AA35VEB0_9HYPO|nr:unnamed protein product [Clonostachys chloroleuca]
MKPAVILSLFATATLAADEACSRTNKENSNVSYYFYKATPGQPTGYQWCYGFYDKLAAYCTISSGKGCSTFAGTVPSSSHSSWTFLVPNTCTNENVETAWQEFTSGEFGSSHCA